MGLVFGLQKGAELLHIHYKVDVIMTIIIISTAELTKLINILQAMSHKAIEFHSSNDTSL